MARQADISRLTAVINTGTPAPTSVVAGMHYAVVATVYIAVNGKQQPSLWDDAKLRMAAAAVAGVH